MDQLTFTPLGGIGDVTKNMYLYEYQNQILIVDCGLGFPDETMLGVDLLLPDISHLLELLKKGKRIVGMVITHGHEDHMGALPFILPQLPQFPIFASPLTAAMANEKLKEFNIRTRVQTTNFTAQHSLGPFTFTLIRVTHSIPDTAHIFIKTPAGNFYHGSDYKFDHTPYDKKVSDIAKIEEVAKEGITALFTDCLGSERKGRTGSEEPLLGVFERELANCKGKFIVTTYSSNVSRLNQVIKASEKFGRKVCFVGRSLIKVKDVAKDLGYLQMRPGTEIDIRKLRNYRDHELTLLIAGSQGQEDSAMTRVANDEHRDVRLSSNDLVVFSADPIPGYEISVYELVDTIARKDIKVLYTAVSSEFHVSGHGSQEEIKELIQLTKPKKLIPISGTFRHMYAYKNLAMDLGYKRQDILLVDDGQEIIFGKEGAHLGRLIPTKNVYVDEVSGEKMESFVLRDRQQLSKAGIVIVLAEVASNGQLAGSPDVIVRGFNADVKKLNEQLFRDLKNVLGTNRGRVINWQHIKSLIEDAVERRIQKDLGHSPLVLPVVIEV
ncbi:MAG TPA: ribonuclease J [Patescibacteria group bacterium]|nr:ribonuclease J [Patescibacteria group bacterium]